MKGGEKLYNKLWRLYNKLWGLSNILMASFRKEVNKQKVTNRW